MLAASVIAAAGASVDAALFGVTTGAVVVVVDGAGAVVTSLLVADEPAVTLSELEPEPELELSVTAKMSFTSFFSSASLSLETSPRPEKSAARSGLLDTAALASFTSSSSDALLSEPLVLPAAAVLETPHTTASAMAMSLRAFILARRAGAIGFRFDRKVIAWSVRLDLAKNSAARDFSMISTNHLQIKIRFEPII